MMYQGGISMRTKLFICLLVVAVMALLPLEEGFAGSSSNEILKRGLLGAGAGAAGSAAGGGNVGTGALVGAGVNVLGGALLDSMSGEKVEDVNNVDSVSPRTAYSDGYEAGYGNGYKKGYTDGYKEGLKESYKSE